MPRKSPALPAGGRLPTSYAREIRPGVWQYTAGPTKGRYAPTRNGVPFLPGWRKDSAGRAYNVAERRERAARTIQAPTGRAKVKASKASYAQRFGISPLGGIKTVYAPVKAQQQIQALQDEIGLPYWDTLLDWARVTFPKGPLENGRGWLIVGQSGKATHWRSYVAEWRHGTTGRALTDTPEEEEEEELQKEGWQIVGSAITQPDIEKAVDSGKRLIHKYPPKKGPAEPETEPLPTPSIALSIPVKRIKPSRWELLTK